MTKKKSFCISQREHKFSGCPRCGCLHGYPVITFKKTGWWRCLSPAGCRERYFVVEDGQEISDIIEGSFYPRLQGYPRYGIPGWSPKSNS